MATFSIGQRVRIIGPADGSSSLVGREATIYDIHRPPGFVERLFGERGPRWSDEALAHSVHPKETAYLLNVDGHGRYASMFWPFGVIGFPAYWLAPLDDPKADAFVEAIKKLKPYEEPKVERERAGALQSRNQSE